MGRLSAAGLPPEPLSVMLTNVRIQSQSRQRAQSRRTALSARTVPVIRIKAGSHGLSLPYLPRTGDARRRFPGLPHARGAGRDIRATPGSPQTWPAAS